MQVVPKLLFTTIAASALFVNANSIHARGSHDPSIDRLYRGDLHVRYPGDVNFGPGNARVKGPEQGVYIEKCYWTAGNTFLGLPLNFTQHCTRHTLENTR